MKPIFQLELKSYIIKAFYIWISIEILITLTYSVWLYNVSV